MANAVMSAAQSLQAQVASALGKPGAHAAADWAPVGITVMIGQNDVPAEQFTTADARTVDDFARTMGAGLLSMWSLNRDAPCAPPLPVVVTKVQTSCSGFRRSRGVRHNARVATVGNPVVAPPTAAVAAGPAATSTATPVVGGVDDPATSPYPIWSPKVDYPADSTVVWHRNVYRAKFWSSDDEPGVPGSAGKPNPGPSSSRCRRRPPGHTVLLVRRGGRDVSRLERDRHLSEGRPGTGRCAGLRGQVVDQGRRTGDQQAVATGDGQRPSELSRLGRFAADGR